MISIVLLKYNDDVFNHIIYRNYKITWYKHSIKINKNLIIKLEKIKQKIN